MYKILFCKAESKLFHMLNTRLQTTTRSCISLAHTPNKRQISKEDNRAQHSQQWASILQTSRSNPKTNHERFLSIPKKQNNQRFAPISKKRRPLHKTSSIKLNFEDKTNKFNTFRPKTTSKWNKTWPRSKNPQIPSPF